MRCWIKTWLLAACLLLGLSLRCGPPLLAAQYQVETPAAVEQERERKKLQEEQAQQSRHGTPGSATDTHPEPRNTGTESAGTREMEAGQARQAREQLIMLIICLALVAGGLLWAVSKWRSRQKKYRLNDEPADAGARAAAKAGATPIATSDSRSHSAPAAAHADPEQETLFARAKALYAERNYTQADSVLRTLLEKNRKHSGAHYYLGLLYYNSHDLVKALERFEAATLADPKNADAYFWLAEILSTDPNQRAAAIKGFKRVVELKPDHANARQRIADLGGVLDPEAPVSENAWKPSPEDLFIDEKSPYLGDIYDLIRARARGDDKSLPDAPSGAAVRLIVDARIAPRRPYLLAYLQDILVIAAGIVGLWIASGIVSGLGQAAYKLQTSAGAAAVLWDNRISGLCMVASLPAIAYLLIYIARKRSMTMSIDRGYAIIKGGYVFRNLSPNYELYEFERFEPRQNFLNMLTGDGTLRLVLVTGKYVDMTGLAKFRDLEAIALRLRSLRMTLRSLPYLGKGIMQ